MTPDNEIVCGAIAFHGHLGPYLILGLKAGMHANEVLGKNPMNTSSLIITNPAPPQSCSADGVQYSTGCTLGKNNITLSKGAGLTITFFREQHKLTLSLRSEILEEIQHLPDITEHWEDCARNLYLRDINALFIIS